MALLLGGCAQQHIVETGGAYQMRQMQHWYEQESWQFAGRLGVVAEQDSFSADIDWRHERSSDVIEMAGPFGQGRLRLVVTQREVVVDDGDQVRIYRQAAERVMAKHFGVEIPVQAFRYWMLGLVEPGVAYQESEQGFIQHGWRVRYRQMQVFGEYSLPHKINLEKAATKVKLIVDQWKMS
nr:lipoprotein insertase outer membrane protein LolB [Methylomarinum sp. Ch1-1]MDP4519034.1 lipoprotein insertase outer membrane protein LolB [Methylomarinum sp. Ch1-1]